MIAKLLRKALSATLAPGFQPASRPDTYLLLLDAEPAQLQVKPEFQHTSTLARHDGFESCGAAVFVVVRTVFRSRLERVVMQRCLR